MPARRTIHRTVIGSLSAGAFAVGLCAVAGDSDQFTWNPGDGNDHVDGDAGSDTLIVNGADRLPSDPFEAEVLQFRSNGTRSSITRIQLPAPNDPNDVIDFSGFELVKAPMAGGQNGMLFDESFATSDVRVVRVDLGPPIDPSQHPGRVNSVQVQGTDRGDRIRVSGSPAAGVTHFRDRADRIDHPGAGSVRVGLGRR